jgi:hypothetical protein
MRTILIGIVLALAIPAVAHAAPPTNDNRADAAVIETFPATIAGTIAESTVERLDPQLSDCGRVESTVWYRVDAAPDGLVVVSVQATTGVAPVVRVYERGRSSIDELDCDAAGAGGRATASFETTRGAGYLVLVGRRPGSPDGGFELTAELFLPPGNDRIRGARPIPRLPATVRGTTLGATGDDTDPARCSLAGGTVWYRMRTQPGRRVLMRLAAAGDLDASLVVVERIRSRRTPVACGDTNARGIAVASFVPRARATYLVVVGHQEGSTPGTFSLRGLPAETSERPPGLALPPSGTRSTVNGLTDVNDLWHVDLRPGATVKIRVASSTCPRVRFRRPRGATLLDLDCNEVYAFTPGADGGGRYVLDVRPTAALRSQSYRLRVTPAGADDLGIGRELPNARKTSGALSQDALDVVDLYHFDVERPSDVRLVLDRSAGTTLTLLRDSGYRIGTGSLVRRTLGPGRYVVAVRGEGKATRYALSLLVRRITRTTLTVSDAAPGLRQPVELRPSVDPVAGGRVDLSIERFDPLTGWHFHRLYRIGTQKSVWWTPPAGGRWRVRARFLGTIGESPSGSAPLRLNVGGRSRS